MRPLGSRVQGLVFFHFFDLNCCTISCNIFLKKNMFLSRLGGRLGFVFDFFFLKKSVFSSFFSHFSKIFAFVFILIFVFAVWSKVTRFTVGRDSDQPTNQSFRERKVNLANLNGRNKQKELHQS